MQAGWREIGDDNTEQNILRHGVLPLILLKRFLNSDRHGLSFLIRLHSDIDEVLARSYCQSHNHYISYKASTKLAQSQKIK